MGKHPPHCKSFTWAVLFQMIFQRWWKEIWIVVENHAGTYITTNLGLVQRDDDEHSWESNIRQGKWKITMKNICRVKYEDEISWPNRQRCVAQKDKIRWKNSRCHLKQNKKREKFTCIDIMWNCKNEWKTVSFLVLRLKTYDTISSISDINVNAFGSKFLFLCFFGIFKS